MESNQSNTSSNSGLPVPAEIAKPAHTRASSLNNESLQKVAEQVSQKRRTNYKLRKVIGKGTYSTVYLGAAPRSTTLSKSRSHLDLPNLIVSFSEEASSSGTNVDVVSQISEVLPESQGKDAKVANEELIALKVIQRPNFQKLDESYLNQKLIFMNDANVLESIQGHPNIVELKEIIPEGIVETTDGQKLHVDYAMAIECLKGGELYYNLRKFGRFSPRMAHYFFCQVLDAVAFMHERGFCHRDLKPWNIMLVEDLSAAKVIDFSYSTPLETEKLATCPQMLRSFLSGTIQFMAPEQVDNQQPFVSDFSKIDVWALGVLLINMLTVDFAFNGVYQEQDRYEAFMKDPSQFFKAQGVEFDSEQELKEICSLLQAMLTLDMQERISIQEAQKLPYVSKYSEFTNDKDGSSYCLATRDEIRTLMRERTSVDATLDYNPSAESLEDSSSLTALPLYEHFSWNLTIVRHSKQTQVSSLDQLIGLFKKSLDDLFRGFEEPVYQLQKFNNHENVILVNIDQKGDQLQDQVKLKKALEVTIVISREADESATKPILISEIFRRKGDYLSFISLYVYLWQQFNTE